MTAAQIEQLGERLGDPITLRRVVRQHKARRVAFWHRRTGELISESGGGTHIAPDAPLSTVLALLDGLSDQLRPRNLFVIGGESAETTPRRTWWAEPVRDGWTFDGYELAAHAATGGADATENAGQYDRAGVRIDVRMSALWFPGVDSAKRCRDAWLSLSLALRRRFDAHATLLATPAMTGLDLLHRSLPTGVRYPLAPSALRELLYRISGQGRFEFCPAPELIGERIAGLYTLDARWMYAACLRGLPTGTPSYRAFPGGADAQEAYLAYTPAWYEITYQAPQDWPHLGLIGERLGEDSVWPATPGSWRGPVWTSGAELDVALRNGWRVLILQRWAYDGPQLPDPTRAWIKALRELREQYYADDAVAGAIRHLALDTVGMWHRRAGEKLRITPLREYPGEPAGRLHHLDRKAGLAYWYEPRPLPKDALPWQRPELSSSVWSRAKARINTAALRIPREHVVAYRADALVTCVEPEPALWLDDGQPGTFRRKGADVRGPIVMPASAGELIELRRQAERAERAEREAL